MYNSEFENLPFDRRGPKPRKSGLTVLIDRYFGVSTQKDFLNLSGDFIDIAKIMVGIPAIIPKNVLKEKIEIYHSNDILAFPGGQFFYDAARPAYHHGLDAGSEDCFSAIDTFQKWKD